MLPEDVSVANAGQRLDALRRRSPTAAAAVIAIAAASAFRSLAKGGLEFMQLISDNPLDIVRVAGYGPVVRRVVSALSDDDATEVRALVGNWSVLSALGEPALAKMIRRGRGSEIVKAAVGALEQLASQEGICAQASTSTPDECLSRELPDYFSTHEM